MESLNAYFTPIAASGERKSGSFRVAVKPLHDLEDELIRAHGPAVEHAREERDALLKRYEHLKAQEAKLRR